ncbi:hypothetical protein LTR36_009311 [Oleoguttula mirabilis]|uniref:Helicase C-terminal domain-containing protein n=1 Tax=Oleoguttula mirabilis TaxID=1507867 RepID=A0AAV9J6S6_9PEZI|nr:hypothetical protein LTR36_009311 [Oleoguttula mirabilis]
MDSGSEDELACSSSAPAKRTQARSKVKPVESDFEDEATSIVQDVSEVNSDVAMDDSSSVATSEHYAEEEEAKAAKPSKASARPKPATKAAAKKNISTVTASTARKTMAEGMKRLLTRPKGQGRGLDPNLPPLHDIDDIFRDVTTRALTLGLDKALDHLRSRPLRVATMCSGTESPLLALQTVHEALKDLGLNTIDVEHVFSAEIVPYKQAYIERNFAPPIIFRDITEFSDAFNSDTPTATTAYGSRVAVPTGVDIVIAGTSCVDYSKLNNKKKDISDGGESGRTWEGALAYCKACRPAIVIFENVVGAAWGSMLEHYRQIDYDCKGVLVDTKDFYIPHTRQRGYMVCFDKRRAGVDAAGMAAQWQTLMQKFQRYASSPVSSFLLPNDQVSVRQQIREDVAIREVDWSQCEITQMLYRLMRGLGYARPFTHWQESGTMVPPENGSASWYHKMVERVLDTIDCCILRKSLPEAGMYDARFKTRIWDLSQNIYRNTDHSPFGITGCITPSGLFFVSDAGRALVPEESLKLQGIPLDKISFTTETPAELQDLAGNAMTSTVVGSALLASLIVGHKLIDPDEALAIPFYAGLQKRPVTMLSYDSVAAQDHTCSSDAAELDVPLMLRDTARSARRCYCEGSYGMSENSLQQCIDCGHTTCTSCGGNPSHDYRQDQTSNNGRLSPSVFEQQLKSRLPLRVSFCDVGDFAELAPSSEDETIPQYLDAVQRAAASAFSFARLRRTHCWTASYVAQNARLDLVIEDSRAEWRLFALPGKDLAREDVLRLYLEQPIAKAVLKATLLDAEWVWRLPIERKNVAKLTVAGSTALTWWARNGLPKYENHAQPDRLLVEITSQGLTAAESSIGGTYRYLPKCGKACDSLYQKVTDAPDERPLYLFLDPTRTGQPEKDSFVFSHNKSLLEYDEVRLIVARVKAPWRPWSTQPQNTKIAPAEISFDDVWQAAPFTIALQACDTAIDVRSAARLPALDSSMDCNSALLLASCRADFCRPESMQFDDAANLVNNTQFLQDNAWVFEAMRRRLSDEAWHTIAHEELTKHCDNCAPQKPHLRWRLADDQTTVAPYEDPVSAAAYERAVKSRPSPLVVRFAAQSDGQYAVDFGVSITSLAHRAVARLPSGVRDVDVSWKLSTQHTTPLSSFSAFKLHATKGIEPHNTNLGMSVSLFPKQRLSLAWMRSQETGMGTKFVIEEAAEATLPVHNWRVEVRASVPVYVRGGVCADHPGFGKTITSLALIQAQLLESTPAQIKLDLTERQGGAQSDLIASTATLIICPGTLMQQWKDEIDDKLGHPKGVLTVNSASQLSRYTLADFENATIILFNRSILTSESYAERLAAFAGIPGPATSSGRSFAQWLTFAKSRVSAHLRVLKASGVSALRAHVRSEYQQVVRSADFKSNVPSRRLRGKNYVAGKSKKAQTESSKAAAASIDVSDVDKPLLEMFYFNRMIIDEFHLQAPKEYAAITAIQADKRWALSATPELADFYDIAKMAGLLGVPLRIGSDARGIMKAKNAKDLRKDMTDFERFDAMREILSSSMHARIHEIDQLFLDTFVRRNIMDFAELKYEDTLVPVVLDLDHRAMYTELSQHLNSSDMKIKKGRRSQATDRQERLHAGIATSATAEEALSKTAAFFKLDINRDADSGAGLAAAILVREHESRDLLLELSGAIINARDGEPEPFSKWIQTRIDDRMLGDEATISDVKRLLRPASIGPPKQIKASKPKASKSKRKRSLSEMEDHDEDESEETAASTKAGGKNALTSAVNNLCGRLVVSKRSLRYLQNVQRLQQLATTSAVGEEHCDSANCHTSLHSAEDVAVSAFCGHAICKDCYNHLRHEQHGKQCPAAGCATNMEPHHLLWTSKMGDLARTSHSPYGAKIDAALDILEDVRKRHDKAILFVQYQQQTLEVQQALKDRKIPALVVKDVGTAGEKIEQFRNSTAHTVIVLNSSDETAAGSNLQHANHVVFLSPLLKEDQYGYEATMAQAIGRVRRHGQQKPIHVYRVVALDTIDVDVLEHRERRVGPMTERGAPAITPPLSASARPLDISGEEAKPERTQLVRERGRYSLRPHSWLVRRGGAEADADADPAEAAKVKGKTRVLGWEDFSSLVKFSRAFTEDDD